MSKRLNFVFNVEKQHLHLAISIVAFLKNVVEMFDSKIKFKMIFEVLERSINLSLETEFEEYKQKIHIISRKYGMILQSKLPMNDLFGEDGESIMELKKMLDLAIVEMQILGSNNSENDKAVSEVKKEAEAVLAQIGSSFVN